MDQAWWDSVEYEGFDLRGFCDDTAAFAKYLIRAREKFEPGFLGSPATYAQWKLANVTGDQAPATALLRAAAVLADKMDSHMVSMGGSGGCKLEDALDGFKFSASGLSDRPSIEAMIMGIQQKLNVNWNKLVAWDKLPMIRKHLDELYSHIQVSEDVTQDTPHVPVAESKRVKLYGPNDRPVAVIDTIEIEKLTPARYAVVKALLLAGEKRLTKDELAEKSGKVDAVNILKRLAKSSALWKSVIFLAGSTGGGYHIY